MKKISTFLFVFFFLTKFVFAQSDQMEINNEIGQCVYDKIGNLGQTIYIINVTDFVNGLYSVKLTNLQTNQIDLHKLIIQK